MVNQQIFLPMIPDSAPIVINISQYDFDAAGYAGRLFFNLVNNGAAYDMDGASAIFQGEKPDGTTFAYPASVVNQSVVRVNVRQQMTAVSGRVICQLIVSNQDGQIGSFNIWLEVQPSSAAGGDPSQTDIPALIAQAKEYADAAEQAAEEVEAYSAHPPYIGANGNWFVYDVGTEQFIDTGVYASGSEGNKWYSGTAISGKSTTPTVYPTGIANALEGDMYLNKSEGAIYQCTFGGADTVAKWAYVMTLAGGGGGASDYPDLGQKPEINGHTLQGGNQTGASLGLQNELTEGDGINIDPVTLELSVDLLAGSNITITPKNGALEISSTGGGGGGGSTVSWNQIQGSTGATKIAEIDIDGNTTDVYAPQGGGGGSVDILPDPTQNPTKAQLISTVLGATNTSDKVNSLWGTKSWSNTECVTIKATPNADFDTIGTWEDDWTTAPVDRTGWIWHESLYHILSDDEVEIRIVNDISGGEVGSLYAYRVDDEVSHNGVNGGAIAIKFNNKLPANTTVAVKLVRQRTEVVNATIIS